MKNIEFEQFELNRLIIAKWVEDLFLYNEYIDHISFSIGTSICSFNKINNNLIKNRVFKERISLLKIGFVPKNRIINYQNYDKLLEKYYSQKQISICDNLINQGICLYHIYFKKLENNDFSIDLINHLHLPPENFFETPLNSNYPFLEFKDIDSFMSLSEYLTKNQLNYLLSHSYLNNLFLSTQLLIDSLQYQFINNFEKNHIYDKKECVLNFEKMHFSFYRNDLKESINSFLGLDLYCKNRELILSQKFKPNNLILKSKKI